MCSASTEKYPVRCCADVVTGISQAAVASPGGRNAGRAEPVEDLNNNAPASVPIPPVQTTVGQELDLDLMRFAFDVDGDDLAVVILGDLPAGTGLFTAAGRVFGSPTQADLAATPLNFRVVYSDPHNLLTEQKLTISVGSS